MSFAPEINQKITVKNTFAWRTYLCVAAVFVLINLDVAVRRALATPVILRISNLDPARARENLAYPGGDFAVEELRGFYLPQ